MNEKDGGLKIRSIIYRSAGNVPRLGAAAVLSFFQRLEAHRLGRLAVFPGGFFYQLQRALDVRLGSMNVADRDSEGITPTNPGVR